jgi:hypothetical protein
MYPRFSVLATGGAIGDALFLFVSGFTLFLSSQRRFDNYYKRRINRIYPSVIMAAIFCMLINFNSGVNILRNWGGEFIVAIMIYYILLYFVQCYLIDEIKWILLTTGFISLIVYVFFFPYKYETSSMGMYGNSTLFRWIPYFSFMLTGAYMGLNYRILKLRPIADFMKLIGCIILFYGIQFSAKIVPAIAPCQIISLLPLMGIVVYLFKWCSADWGKRLARRPFLSKCVMLVAGLCLESYLIQFTLFTPRFNSIWPLNIPMIMIVILVCSYIVRCGARIFIQTFRTEDYDWKGVFKI